MNKYLEKVAESVSSVKKKEDSSLKKAVGVVSGVESAIVGASAAKDAKDLPVSRKVADNAKKNLKSSLAGVPIYRKSQEQSIAKYHNLKKKVSGKAALAAGLGATSYALLKKKDSSKKKS